LAALLEALEGAFAAIRQDRNGQGSSLFPTPLQSRGGTFPGRTNQSMFGRASVRL